MGTEAWQKERRRTGSHICRPAGGGHQGPQRLLAGSNGWQGWLEKESHGGSTEVGLVVEVYYVKNKTEIQCLHNTWPITLFPFRNRLTDV